MIRRGARKKAPGANRYGLTPGAYRVLTKYFASTFLQAMHCMRTSTGRFAPAGATKGLSARPLETFGAHTCWCSCMLGYGKALLSCFCLKRPAFLQQYKRAALLENTSGTALLVCLLNPPGVSGCPGPPAGTESGTGSGKQSPQWGSSTRWRSARPARRESTPRAAAR